MDAVQEELMERMPLTGELNRDVGPGSVPVRDLPESERAQLRKAALGLLADTGADEFEIWPPPMPVDEEHEWEGDKELHVEFYHNAVIGRDCLRITIPSDERFRHDEMVREGDKVRFRRQWEAFQQRRDQSEGETRLEDVPWMDLAMLPGLKSVGLHTVEQLAAVSDGGLKYAGLRPLREKARRDVDARRRAEEALKATAGMRDEMERKDQALEEMRARLAALEAKGAPKRAAPAKAAG